LRTSRSTVSISRSSKNPSLPLARRTAAYRETADWPQEETEAAGNGGTTQHLWEESWDDDDTSDDFSAQLKYRDPAALVPHDAFANGLH